MAIPELLDALLRVPGPSGQEARAAAAWRERCEPFAAEVDVDVNGSSWARIPGRSSGGTDPGGDRPHRRDRRPHHAHRRRGLPAVRPGRRLGSDAAGRPADRARHRDGQVRGVIGRKAIHQLDEDERKKAPELKNLHIDIGAASGDEARERVRIGDTGVIDVPAAGASQQPRRLALAGQPRRLLRGRARRPAGGGERRRSRRRACAWRWSRRRSA